jgi:prefoldin subunit 2|tara:strand:+ start:1336 stop:1842 length:507 start_codon:yes stop_codon:yes gene_type:complete
MQMGANEGVSITPIRTLPGATMSEITDAAKAPATAGTDADPASEKDVINTFQQLRQDASQLFTKINELENEKAEHVLVIDAIKDLDPKRKCFRLIGGVLVERTVEEVLPAVNKNKEGLAAVIEKLMQQRDDKVDRVEYLQKKYKIRVKGEPDPEEDEDGDAGKQGVLA